MTYRRPILASVYYFVAWLAAIVTTGLLISARKADPVVWLLIGGYGFGATVLAAGLGQAYSLIGRIAHNTDVLREEAESRRAERHAAAVGGPGAERIPGIN
ncbi:hypothetical protein [Opitutus terrae]|uniref:Uncharacterized protein n=1 Tax=Opitutus terrae (strain DSM 11246 / JCM 15787 / PB90-1) TaxID=452637 RepID=B1ZUC3_OPITP|nr:hypothetical protein [Opitutus terrae]ACB76685.1 hypothetical protein Oter_3408 [Opitutus terrae PB90-1]